MESPLKPYNSFSLTIYSRATEELLQEASYFLIQSLHLSSNQSRSGSEYQGWYCALVEFIDTSISVYVLIMISKSDLTPHRPFNKWLHIIWCEKICLTLVMEAERPWIRLCRAAMLIHTRYSYIIIISRIDIMNPNNEEPKNRTNNPTTTTAASIIIIKINANLDRPSKMAISLRHRTYTILHIYYCWNHSHVWPCASATTTSRQMRHTIIINIKFIKPW